MTSLLLAALVLVVIASLAVVAGDRRERRWESERPHDGWMEL